LTELGKLPSSFTPMRRIRSGWCARAASGHAAAAPPSSVMNSRRPFDHLVGERQQLVGHFKAERLRRPEIDYQLKFRGLLDRQVGRLLALRMRPA
jgi:hypothetical protein